MEKDTQSKGQHKRCSHNIRKKMDLKTKGERKDKSGQNIMLQGTVHQEHILLFLFLFQAPNIGAPNI